MNILTQIRALLTKRRPMKLDVWFYVTFDENCVYLRANPPGKKSWSQEFTWESVNRVCFKAEDFLISDGIYVFISERPESYVVPIEANGGSAFWDEIIRRNLFDIELAIKANSSTGGMFCWPPE